MSFFSRNKRETDDTRPDAEANQEPSDGRLAAPPTPPVPEGMEPWDIDELLATSLGHDDAPGTEALTPESYDRISADEPPEEWAEIAGLDEDEEPPAEREPAPAAEAGYLADPEPLTISEEMSDEELAEAVVEQGTGAPLQSDDDTKRLLKALKKQQKLRAEQDLAEAKALEEQAKQMMKQAKERKKLRSELESHSEKVRMLAPELGLDPERPITVIPEIDEDHLQQAEFTTIKEGYAYVRVLFNTRQNRYLYEVLEPELSRTEREVLEFLRDTLVRTLEARPGLDEDELEEYLLEAIDRAVIDHSILIDDVSRARLKYYLIRDFLGYGPIDVLMHDPMIEDISCDGPGIPIYLFHRQYESIRTNVVYEDDLQLDSFVIRLAQRAGKHISISEPMLDATLPDTSRLQATLSREITTRGSSFTIRRFRSDPLTPPDLVRLGTISSEMAAWYWLSMEEGMSLIYSGGTASGKTTSLNAICQFIPPERKVVSIEDTRELNLIHENWIAGLTRSGFGAEGTSGRQAGSIDMYKLLESALRQRPEYLMVGEVRGPEAKTLFQAMATGHATYSTMHADSVKSAVYRLENPPINVPRMMLQTLDSISVQVQARLNQRMVRRVKEVTEVVGIDPETGDLLTNTVFKWDASTDTHRFYGKSVVLEAIAEKNSLSTREVLKEMANRQEVIEWMVERGIRHITDVSDVLASYYARPDALLDQIRGSGQGGLRHATLPEGNEEDIEHVT